MPDSKPDQTAPVGASEPAEPTAPIDRMIAGLHKWLDETEAKLEQAAQKATIPDDIPCFITRYQP